MISRRTAIVGASAAIMTSTGLSSAGAQKHLMGTIPSTGETIPAIGMGTWLTFDIGADSEARAVRTEVLRTFFAAGGRVIDSSPMYGTSQAVVGAALDALNRPPQLFAADKVWTPGGENGPSQIARTRSRWGVEKFDLLQVHNLVDWRQHLELLFAMKAEGAVRYVGVTTYAGLRHAELETIMTSQPIDFIQVTYNLADRDVEARILPLARERKIAVIANRPFREGALTAHTAGVKMPDFAAEIGASTWPELMLKFIISHPSVTVAIPATRRVDHMTENMRALSGPVPDNQMRRKIAAAFAAI